MSYSLKIQQIRKQEHKPFKLITKIRMEALQKENEKLKQRIRYLEKLKP